MKQPTALPIKSLTSNPLYGNRYCTNSVKMPITIASNKMCPFRYWRKSIKNNGHRR